MESVCIVCVGEHKNLAAFVNQSRCLCYAINAIHTFKKEKKNTTNKQKTDITVKAAQFFLNLTTPLLCFQKDVPICMDDWWRLCKLISPKSCFKAIFHRFLNSSSTLEEGISVTVIEITAHQYKDLQSFESVPLKQSTVLYGKLCYCAYNSSQHAQKCNSPPKNLRPNSLRSCI